MSPELLAWAQRHKTFKQTFKPNSHPALPKRQNSTPIGEMIPGEKSRVPGAMQLTVPDDADAR
jgi:hypothetical protein